MTRAVNVQLWRLACFPWRLQVCGMLEREEGRQESRRLLWGREAPRGRVTRRAGVAGKEQMKQQGSGVASETRSRAGLAENSDPGWGCDTVNCAHAVGGKGSSMLALLRPWTPPSREGTRPG